MWCSPGAGSLSGWERLPPAPMEVGGMRKVPNLSISPEKAFFIVAKARQSDSGASGPGSASDADDDMPEDHRGDTDRSELSGFIRGLNVDEQIDLVALMWLGRPGGGLDGLPHLPARAGA